MFDLRWDEDDADQIAPGALSAVHRGGLKPTPNDGIVATTRISQLRVVSGRNFVEQT
jgi:hypothetical protein